MTFRKLIEDMDKNSNGVSKVLYSHLCSFDYCGSDEDYYFIDGLLWGLYYSGQITDKERETLVSILLRCPGKERILDYGL